MNFTDKYVFHLPLYRILKRIVLMGVPLPSSTLESWVKLGAQLLLPLYAVNRLHVTKNKGWVNIGIDKDTAEFKEFELRFSIFFTLVIKLA
ncbi:MAG: transposase [Salinivirgaceae bacterium]|nr:transposase [Salinivirgaceae bacterium]